MNPKSVNAVLENYKFQGLLYIKYKDKQHKFIHNLKGKHIKTNTLFPIASMAKLYYGVLCVRLLQKKILKNLKIQIHKYFGKYQDLIPEQITIMDLLVHNSGYFELRAHPKFNKHKIYTLNEFVKFILTTKGMYRKHDYGTGVYATTNYVLLSYILQKITKQSIYDLLEEYVFIPMKLTNTYFIHDVLEDKKLLAQMAKGHDDELNLVLIPKYWTYFNGCDIVTNYPDLYKFIHKTKQLLGTKGWKYYIKPRKKTHGGQYMTIGGRTLFINDHQFILSAGHFPGYHVSMIFHHSLNFIIIALSNIDKVKSVVHMDDIAKWIAFSIINKTPFYIPPKKAKKISLKAMKQLVGMYSNEYGWYKVYIKDNKLTIKSRKQTTPLIYLGNNRWYRNLYSYVEFTKEYLTVSYLNKKCFKLFKE